MKIIKKQKAFTLIEVLVAFTIMAMTIGILLEIFTRSTTSLIRSQAYTQAAIIAQSQLARVGIDIEIENGQETGKTKSEFEWLIDIAPYNLSETVEFSEQFEAWLVTVDVSWNHQQSNPSHYILKTFRIKKK